MKTDAEVLLMKRERAKGRTQEQAAARAGMSVRTARQYEQRAQLPSRLKRPRTYQTRPDPFAADWPWIRAQLEGDAALPATTLFALLCDQYPGRYQAIQLWTLQRHIAAWRLAHGPAKAVIFPQMHRPGERAQSDFTHMTDLGITLGGVLFPHLVFHLVLTYSNMEAVHVCLSEGCVRSGTTGMTDGCRGRREAGPADGQAVARSTMTAAQRARKRLRCSASETRSPR